MTNIRKFTKDSIEDISPDEAGLIDMIIAGSAPSYCSDQVQSILESASGFSSSVVDFSFRKMKTFYIAEVLGMMDTEPGMKYWEIVLKVKK